MGHPEWKEITRAKILREMENHLLPAIGSKPIDTLKTRDLLPLLIDMTNQGIGATTGRVKTTMGSIFRYAVQRGIVDYNPAHDLKGAITNPKVRHRPALPLERLPELMTRAVNYTGRPLTRLAVLFPYTLSCVPANCAMPGGKRSTLKTVFGQYQGSGKRSMG